MSPDILDLAEQVGAALGWLEDAIATAGELTHHEEGATPEGQPILKHNGWVDMDRAAERLECARVLLERALAPLQDVIDEARKQRSEEEDRWDAQRI